MTPHEHGVPQESFLYVNVDGFAKNKVGLPLRVDEDL